MRNISDRSRSNPRGLSMKMEIFYDSHELILNSEKISWVRM